MKWIDRYDAGLLGGDSTWSVEDWHDAIRSYLDDAHEHYEHEFNDLIAELDNSNKKVRQHLDAIEASLV